jgi:transcription initiation factor TFIIIB Brf1 subunit/transcription initiation factor TFIIB
MIADPIIANCKNCKTSTIEIIDYSEGTVICKSCGLVFEQRMIETKPEWRCASEKESDPTRVGAEINSFSQLSNLSLNVSGLKTNSKQGIHFAQLKGDSDDTLIHMIIELKKLCSSLELNTKFVLKAQELLSHLKINNKSLQGRELKPLVVAIIFCASRHLKYPLLQRDLLIVADVKSSQFTNALKFVKQYITWASMDPESYADQFCCQLKLDCQVSNTVVNVCNSLVKKGIFDGRSPATIAALALTTVVRLTPSSTVSVEEIAEVADLSVYTIQQNFKTLLKHKEQVVPLWDNRLSIDNLSR